MCQFRAGAPGRPIYSPLAVTAHQHENASTWKQEDIPSKSLSARIIHIMVGEILANYVACAIRGNGNAKCSCMICSPFAESQMRSRMVDS